MKTETRVIGIDDASFNKFKDKHALVVGTFYRGGNFLDGVITTKIRVDGDDATEKIAKAVNKSKFKPQLKAIFLDGIAVGGFNVIDIERLNKKTRLPVIVVIRKYPDFRRIYSVLKKLKMRSKIKLMEKAGKPIRMGKLYVQLKGIGQREAKELLKITCTHSYLPEPIRIAHLIGQGIAMGESKGNA